MFTKKLNDLQYLEIVTRLAFDRMTVLHAQWVVEFYFLEPANH